MDKQVIIYPYVKILLNNEKEPLLIKARTWVNIRKSLCQVKEARHRKALAPEVMWCHVLHIPLVTSESLRAAPNSLGRE